MNKRERINKMYEYARENGLCRNKLGFSEVTGIANSTLSKAMSGNEQFLTDGILIKVNDALGNPFCLDYLIHGVEPMYRSEIATVSQPVSSKGDKLGVFQTEKLVQSQAAGEGIPLLPIEAVAGFNGTDVDGVRLEDCPRYIVPEFVDANVDFLIRVKGRSMQPQYCSGDILACRIIKETLFFQWGNTYVIDTSQGAMVKRLYPSEQSADLITCKSENPEFPSFDIPKTDLRVTAIVVGLIRIEND